MPTEVHGSAEADLIKDARGGSYVRVCVHLDASKATLWSDDLRVAGSEDGRGLGVGKLVRWQSLSKKESFCSSVNRRKRGRKRKE